MSCTTLGSRSRGAPEGVARDSGPSVKISRKEFSYERYTAYDFVANFKTDFGP